MYWWKDFDRSEVEAEFSEIAAFKLQVVRIFMLWEDFQPAPDQVNQQALSHLGMVLELAQEVGLRIMPTFFTGFMSGVSWWPRWALSDEEDPSGVPRLVDGHFTLRAGRDPYTDPLLLAAQRLLVATVSARFGQHPALYGWDWGNEHDNFFTPRCYEDGLAWHRMLTDEARRFSSTPVTSGQHFPMLTGYTGFRADQLARVNDIQCMHAYSIYYPSVLEDEPLNSDVVPLACLVTEALSGERVLFQEFGYASSQFRDVSEYRLLDLGGSQPHRQYLADDAAGARYYQEVLEKLVRCGALGAFAWVFSDYDEHLWHLPPFKTHQHERFFGLTRADGVVKLSGKVLQSFAQRIAEGDVPTRTIKPFRLEADTWYENPSEHFDRLFQEWRGRL
jgi:endo-1,4-beta-mannosidase